MRAFMSQKGPEIGTFVGAELGGNVGAGIGKDVGDGVGTKLGAEGRAGKTEGLGEFGAFSPFWGESGRREALSGSFLGREGPQKSTPYPGFKLEFKKTHLKSKNAT